MTTRKLNVLKKDLKLFFRDKKNLILVILAPVIIMLILANVFSGTSKEEYLSNIKMGLCNDDPTFTLTYDIKTETIEENCRQTTIDEVLKGNLRGTLVVPKNFSANIKDGFGSTLELYLDNSKGQTALALSTAIESLVNSLNEDISKTFINEAWTNLRQLNKKIKFVVENLKQTKLVALTIQERTDNLTKIINQVNDTKIDAYIQDINKSILLLENNLEIIDSLIREINLSEVSEPETNATDESNESVNNTINDSIIPLQKTHPLLQNISAYITEAQNNLTVAKSVLQNISIQLVKVKEARNDAKNQVNELNSLVKNFTQQIISLQTELENTVIVLEDYTSRDPESIIRAVSLEKQESFSERNKFSFIAPGIILIVLMLITLLVSSAAIVDEKKSGTMLRNILAPVSLFSFMFQKVLYLLMLAFLQLFFMFLVAYFYGAIILFNFNFLIVLLLSALVFVSLGMLIGSLSKTENTSLLTSLVIAIPLMFLSGVFFPFESMPTFMATLGFNNPLTMSIFNLEKVLTYQSSLDTFSLLMLVLLSLLFFIIAVELLKRKPQVD